MARNSRVPPAVGSIPLVGGLVRSADSQAQWLQELVEQNARLVGQLPATVRTFNESLERFNRAVDRLDTATTLIESTTARLSAPLEQVVSHLDQVASTLDVPSLRDVPELLDALRREALPALHAATDTQKQVALLTATLDAVVSVLNELPGARLVRRLTGTGGELPAEAAESEQF